MWFVHGILRLLKESLKRPVMKTKILIKNLHKTNKTSKYQKDFKLVSLLKADLEERQLQYGIKHPGMKMVLMVISIHVMILVTRLWVVDSMKEEVLEIPTTQLDSRHATMLVTLLHIVVL